MSKTPCGGPLPPPPLKQPLLQLASKLRHGRVHVVYRAGDAFKVLCGGWLRAVWGQDSVLAPTCRSCARQLELRGWRLPGGRPR